MKQLTVFMVFVVLALSLALSATPVFANGIPALPHAFYGSVTINGDPAPVGTEVEARGTGVLTGIADNPTVTTVSGIYGTANPFQHRLIVQGNIEEGATITFYVNGHSTDQTTEWHSGETTELPLSVTIPEEAEVVGVGPAAAPTLETNLFGTAASFRISDEGKILKTIIATSADGNLTITIPQGTIALDKYGNPLSSLTAVIDPSPPDPPEGGTIIGLVYDFGPDGATFEPPITFTWSYDPDALPEDVAEEELVIAYYDEDAVAWVECDCTCDPEAYCVTASVSHFCCFAIIGTLIVEALPVLPEPAVFSVSNLSVMPVEVGPGGLVTVTLTVANTGGTVGSYTAVLKLNGVKEAEKSVTVAAGGSQTITFFVSIKETGSYTVSVDGLSASLTVVAPKPPVPPVTPEEVEEMPAKPISWPLVGGLIAAAVVVVAVLVYFLWVRPRAY